MTGQSDGGEVVRNWMWKSPLTDRIDSPKGGRRRTSSSSSVPPIWRLFIPIDQFPCTMSGLSEPKTPTSAGSSDYALQALSEIRYGVWREYDPEDSLRFYALRMHEAGLIKSSLNELIAEHTDWHFLNKLKRELKV
jgi:hypothetical protein